VLGSVYLISFFFFPKVEVALIFTLLVGFP
jgi:hypothetical protein